MGIYSIRIYCMRIYSKKFHSVRIYPIEAHNSPHVFLAKVANVEIQESVGDCMEAIAFENDPVFPQPIPTAENTVFVHMPASRVPDSFLRV